ncbi:MAG: hypothetical protein JWM88_1219 [Verrucomicrobia bacterium]|nr:hypothetical protein [Verrucomicrobiota bacterium]
MALTQNYATHIPIHSHMSNPVELTVTMKIDVDGAPNAYCPHGMPALDFELNAHEDAVASGKIVGYLTKNNDGRTPIQQGPADPFPGCFISTTAFQDKHNSNDLDPRKNVDASKINYVVRGTLARQNGVHLGDFVAVHSKKHGRSVYGIVGDAGNSSGAEGSLALIQSLGYPFQNGKSGESDHNDVVIRYFPGSNPNQQFFSRQSDLDAAAAALGLSKSF